MIENDLHIACSCHKLILTTFVDILRPRQNTETSTLCGTCYSSWPSLWPIDDPGPVPVPESGWDKQFSLHAYQSALDGYRQFQKSHPDDQEVILRIARCAYLLNQPADAADWYLKAGRSRKNPQDLTWFARSQMMNENYPAAIEL